MIFKKVDNKEDELKYFSQNSKSNLSSYFEPYPESLPAFFATIALIACIFSGMSLLNVYRCNNSPVTYALVDRVSEYRAYIEFQSPTGKIWKDNPRVSLFSYKPQT